MWGTLSTSEVEHCHFCLQEHEYFTKNSTMGLILPNFKFITLWAFNQIALFNTKCGALLAISKEILNGEKRSAPYIGGHWKTAFL